MFKNSQGLIFAIFVVVACISANLAYGLIYGLVFICVVVRKQYVYPVTVFLTSLFLDMCSFSFVGITALPLLVFYLLVDKYKTFLQNFKISMASLLAFLCACKFVSFVLVSMLGYSFDVVSHLKQVVAAVWIYVVYCFIQKNKEVHIDA